MVTGDLRSVRLPLLCWEVWQAQVMVLALGYHQGLAEAVVVRDGRLIHGQGSQC